MTEIIPTNNMLRRANNTVRDILFEDTTDNPFNGRTPLPSDKTNNFVETEVELIFVLLIGLIKINIHAKNKHVDIIINKKIIMCQGKN